MCNLLFSSSCKRKIGAADYDDAWVGWMLISGWDHLFMPLFGPFEIHQDMPCASDEDELANNVTACVNCDKTSQELRMLSSVTINCQVPKIVMNSDSQLSEL